MADVAFYEPSAPTRAPADLPDVGFGGTILSVERDSPADRAGLEPGMVVLYVNDAELDDLITWQWEADGFDVQVEVFAGVDESDGALLTDAYMVSRELGEDWGVEFDGAVFDGMRLCRNRCTFCFMRMLPKGMRRTLYMRDDDYRLSFLQGNFVTLTNMTDEDVERVVGMALSPLNVSLHAISPDVRASLIGPHAARGIEVLEALLAGGIEIHAQIVLVPGENDGPELARTLAYVDERPLITSLGIVPLGYTKHQDRFHESFDAPGRAQAVIDEVEPYQRRSRALCGRTRYQLADEFYLFAGVEPPVAEFYDGYPQYHDGIGMVRSFIDDLAQELSDEGVRERLAQAGRAARDTGARALLVCAGASADMARRLVGETRLRVCVGLAVIRNDYFGGNVDVTGLLTAQDILAQLPESLPDTAVIVPRVCLNADGLTLDGVPGERLCEEVGRRGRSCRIVAAEPHDLIDALCEMLME